MVKRILGFLGWLGVVFVFSALAISQLRPEWTWFRGLAIAGLVCTLLYILSQWREIGREMSGRQARYGTLAAAQRPRRAGDPGRHQLPRRAPEQALGPDRGAPVHPVGPDARRCCRA